jgi:hypothetical protein
MGYAPFRHSQVVGRHIFYNDSAYDGNDALASALDDGAIAPNKQALLPGGTATFANYTSYSKGINGIMIDVAGLAGTPTAGDFSFRVGNDDTPGGWTPLATPPSVSVRSGAGVNGSDRVTLIWPNGVIAKQWLQSTMNKTAQTGLGTPNVFYFGSAIGETGNSPSDARVTSADELLARLHPHTIANPTDILDPYDFNRDTRVTALDQNIARLNRTTLATALNLIHPPASLLAAPLQRVGAVTLLAASALRGAEQETRSAVKPQPSEQQESTSNRKLNDGPSLAVPASGAPANGIFNLPRRTPVAAHDRLFELLGRR